MLLVMFSQASVKCSPMKASWKPSLSARMMASRSSFSVSAQFRCIGCTGIVKYPSLILLLQSRQAPRPGFWAAAQKGAHEAQFGDPAQAAIYGSGTIVFADERCVGRAD